MRITIKHDGMIKCTHYRAGEGYNSAIVSVYDWPVYNRVHVVAVARGLEPLSFMAESFSAANAVNLLKVYVKAYL